jgi:hypothetical protein
MVYSCVMLSGGGGSSCWEGDGGGGGGGVTYSCSGTSNGDIGVRNDTLRPSRALLAAAGTTAVSMTAPSERRRGGVIASELKTTLTHTMRTRRPIVIAPVSAIRWSPARAVARRPWPPGRPWRALAAVARRPGCGAAKRVGWDRLGFGRKTTNAAPLAP